MDKESRNREIYQRRLHEHESLQQLADAFHLSRQRIFQIIHAQSHDDPAYLNTDWIAVAARNRMRPRVETKCPVCGTIRADPPAVAAARIACSKKCANSLQRKHGQATYAVLIAARANGEKWKDIGAKLGISNPSALFTMLKQRLGGQDGTTHLSDEGRLSGAVSDHGDRPSEG